MKSPSTRFLLDDVAPVCNLSTQEPGELPDLLCQDYVARPCLKTYCCFFFPPSFVFRLGLYMNHLVSVFIEEHLKYGRSHSPIEMVQRVINALGKAVPTRGFAYIQLTRDLQDYHTLSHFTHKDRGQEPQGTGVTPRV